MIKSYVNILNKLSGKKKENNKNWKKSGSKFQIVSNLLAVLIDFELKAFLLTYMRLVIPNLFRDLIKIRSRQLMAS